MSIVRPDYVIGEKATGKTFGALASCHSSLVPFWMQITLQNVITPSEWRHPYRVMSPWQSETTPSEWRHPYRVISPPSEWYHPYRMMLTLQSDVIPPASSRILLAFKIHHCYLKLRCDWLNLSTTWVLRGWLYISTEERKGKDISKSESLSPQKYCSAVFSHL